MYVRPIATGEMIRWYYCAYAVVLAYARNVRHFARPGESVGYQFSTFALAPLYALLHVVVLTPLRLWSLFTLHRTQEGAHGPVEVAM